eukprot:CAMPEP_0177628576 /NCGR_PEP_ID=MMETSP0447-20121125/205_1 /TAXON_ID=0 /ORGANISM="Stygamoeba regulata, Strain BSH-02190019" /LENGTH=64 /DNA_ID=CAMNT_0019129833 /DNA_START=1914 /DNA_END=2108 /DNA_ORIENTATION=-
MTPTERQHASRNAASARADLWAGFEADDEAAMALAGTFVAEGWASGDSVASVCTRACPPGMLLH